jgi:hypothetical protein
LITVAVPRNGLQAAVTVFDRNIGFLGGSSAAQQEQAAQQHTSKMFSNSSH